MQVIAGGYNPFMLGRIFITLCALPGMRKRMWRGLYQYLARSQPGTDWTFMNYGFAAAGGGPLALAEADERDRHFIQLYDHVAKPVDLAGRDVLEVGSGRGGGSSFIHRYKRPAKMVGVDLSANAVQFSRSTHGSGVEFKVGDAENLPLPDNSFDAVINVESSHCYPRFDRFLGEVRRVLKPGGHFLYADFRYLENVPAWREAMEKSGLSLVREADITSNVIAALDEDDARKREQIDARCPKLLHRSFYAFAALRGSSLYESFRDGKLVYMSFVLQKPLT